MTGQAIPRVERVLTRGDFTLDGQTFKVDNNVWLLGDDTEVLVIDASHDPAVILAAVAGRRVAGIVATHGHNDHINAAVELADLANAPIALHRADHLLWEAIYPHRRPDRALVDGAQIPVPGGMLHVLHTPGHSPGGVCLFGPFASGPTLFSGDTLFRGGPGATGRSGSDFPTILASIRERLLTLPPETVVHPGHGDDTTIGAELPDYDAWVARGH
ncbi:MBL fold metallo-hydrolase [Frankia sp. CNm7]|uniref:MBL fold metallo-hydrolase n=1 Tax=Frankia nepalensis TaxID=1836974 RepID=A0A937US36_9ACTN|nr:MBL fold metallo-hydrolase [Frankia nepalensis]MBL7497796.1 MBL fold metallo-hydrolase [Frankia nepalensis]MBL7511299.1 MBL fold metallo-hydrolase [Frankia nepalensis]MBL7517680.1 MBL fold metallo-hydrolase [Frankia nepalensis]MBL7629865.1 MBL fold metallo-hydrolase [Frankia nepalensis]